MFRWLSVSLFPSMCSFSIYSLLFCYLFQHILYVSAQLIILKRVSCALNVTAILQFVSSLPYIVFFVGKVQQRCKCSVHGFVGWLSMVGFAAVRYVFPLEGYHMLGSRFSWNNSYVKNHKIYTWWWPVSCSPWIWTFEFPQWPWLHTFINFMWLL